MSLQQFLNTAKRAVLSEGLRSKTLVLGNESCDLDSVACSVGYAYLAHRHNAQDIAPVFCINKEDLRLRPELRWILAQTDIQADDLLFLDDLPEADCKLVLVDMNDIPGQLKDKFGKNVEAIIDHHVDEGAHQQAKPRIIRTCGSCSSLVAQHFRDDLAPSDVSLVMLFTAAILSDTANFTNKDTKDDKDAFEILRQKCSSFDVEAFFDGVSTAKKDVKDLSSRDLLRRDSKEFTTKQGVLGTSAMSLSLQDLRQRKDWADAIFAWVTERHLVAHLTNTNFGKDEGFSRELLLWSKDTTIPERFEKEATELGLKRQDAQHIDFTAWKQRNLKASRKQVSPILRQVMSS